MNSRMMMNSTKDKVLSPDEAGYVMGLIREHLEYYRMLADNPKCTQQNRKRYELVLGLWEKLAK